VQQRHRDLVELVGVVDRQDEAVAGALAEAGQGGVQEVVAQVGVVARGQHVGERPERDVAGGLGGPHPLDPHAVQLQFGDGLGEQARLPDARLAEQRRPARPAVGRQQAADLLQLVRSPDEWPPCDHGQDRTPRKYVAPTDPAQLASP
jgi:hypothetical protein